jgi:hypothetical protein
MSEELAPELLVPPVEVEVGLELLQAATPAAKAVATATRTEIFARRAYLFFFIEDTSSASRLSVHIPIDIPITIMTIPRNPLFIEHHLGEH